MALRGGPGLGAKPTTSAGLSDPNGDNFVCALPPKGGPSAVSVNPISTVSLGPDGQVPGRLTDTETRLKISGELPLWFNQKKSKYLKHMLHLFNTGIAMFVSAALISKAASLRDILYRAEPSRTRQTFEHLVGQTHAYLLKIKSVLEGESPKHIEVKYISSMFVKIDAEQEGGISYYSADEGVAMIKTGNKGETHVLMDHFAQQKLQPQNCKCPERISPCKCYLDPRKLLMSDPATFQQFTGTTGSC